MKLKTIHLEDSTIVLRDFSDMVEIEWRYYETQEDGTKWEGGMSKFSIPKKELKAFLIT